MQFLLSLIGEEPNFDEISPEEMQAEMDKMDAYNRELEAAGAFFLGGGLQERANARTVRFGEGGPAVTDGPFAETKEQLGGFYLIDVPNLDEAIAIAARHPGARLGTVEIRTVLEIPGLPAD